MNNIRRGAFQRLGSDLARFVDDLVRRPIDRGPRNRRRTCTPGAIAEWNLVGIAFNKPDVVDVELQSVRGDLRKGDVVALAVRVTAGEEGDLSVRVHAHDRTFPAAMQSAPESKIGARPSPGLVDEAGKSNAHKQAFLAQL